METRSLRKLAECHSVPPDHNASPQLPRLLLCDTGLMACLSFPLLNKDGHGGEGAMGERVRHVSNSELSAQLILAINQVVTENIPEAAGIFTISIKR